jgi:DNA-binding NarL/FixJ family response regulator
VPLNLVLIEDHPALRQGLQLLLEHRGYEVVGAGGDAEAARSLIDTLAPDVVIVDVNLGNDSGIDLTRELLVSHPFCRIVLYTGSRDPEVALSGLEAGAMGYALKDGNPDELMQAIQAAAEDNLYVDPRMGLEFDDLPLDDEAVGKRKLLTRREREIMSLLAQGQTGEQVATLLVLSAETVKTHIRNAMVRLHATTRVHAIALALRDGEITAPGVASVRFRRRDEAARP